MGEGDRFCTRCGAATGGTSVPSRKRFANLLELGGARKLALYISLLVIIVLLLCAALAPFLAPHGPHEVGLLKGGQRVGPFVSLETPLGVDRLERDTLSRLIYGARFSVVVILSTVALSAAVGGGLGLAAGYSGGWVDQILVGPAAAISTAISSITPGWGRTLLSVVLLALGFYIALVLVSNLGAGINNVVVALSVVGVPRISLAVRNVIRGGRCRKPADAEDTVSTTLPVSSKRGTPFSIAIALLVVGSLQAKQIMVAEVLLGYLGVGIGWGEPSWGSMVAEGRVGNADVWFPAACVACTVAALYFSGHWVRARLGSKLPEIARL